MILMAKGTGMLKHLLKCNNRWKCYTVPYEFNQNDLAYKHINGKGDLYVKISAYVIIGGNVRQCRMNLINMI